MTEECIDSTHTGTAGDEARQAEAHAPAHPTETARDQRKASTEQQGRPAHQKQSSRGARGSEEDENQANETGHSDTYVNER